MKASITLAAFFGTICLMASCGGDGIKPDNGGDNGGSSQEPEKPYVDGSTTVAGHEALDLGTDLLWATTNLGASEPSDFGTYYAWGETSKKTEYKWSNYKWSDGVDPEVYSKPDGEIMMTKYCLYKVYGTKDDKKVLEPVDDAATQSWGGGWRMPTLEEVNALLSKCRWEWAREEGLYGYKISSKKTGKSIFIPAAGMVAYDGPHNSTFFCNYWTASLHDKNEQYYAYSFVFHDEGHENSPYVSQTYRYLGMTIRPVCDKKESED